MTTPARATDIVFTRHGARRGLAWLLEAYRMFRQARLAWVVLLSLYYLLMLVLSKMPYVAPVLLLLVKPVFAVGLLAAAWTQERGGKPAPSQLFSGFRANLQALLALGVMLVAGVIGAVLATALFDGGLLVDMLSKEQPVAGSSESVDKGAAATTDELLKLGKLQGSIFIAALLAMPTVLALWFAPALVVFQDAGPATALGASLRAALANWRPLIVYALAVLLFGALLPIIVAQFIVMLLPSQATIGVVYVGYLVYALMFAATLHISDYVSYRDIFHAGETLAPLSPASGGDRS